ncbi:WW domain-binding protein 2-like [Littorina saxatilis]|uniref:GRAM domain-containing protein n=1 Tax=Littorina saxatilis TaxID=31220 RepID=A0AAN9BVM6_9CAEN
MALNTAHAQGGVLIFATERILIYYDGIEMQFDGPGMPHFKGKKKGRIFLTTHRVIFNSTDPKDTMQSFSIPFLQMREVELEQPVFGANYIKGRVLAEPYGNWEGEAKFKMYFTHGGAIEFGQAMLRAASLASKNRRPQPPSYTPPAYGNIYAAPPPAYQPPQDPYYNWVPYQTFPTAPPQNSVYMTEAPPPYPGINPDMAPYPPTANGYDDKAKEAAASAYYNPGAPHMMYASAPPPPNGYAAPPYQGHDPPPAYDQVTKKND